MNIVLIANMFADRKPLKSSLKFTQYSNQLVVTRIRVGLATAHK